MTIGIVTDSAADLSREEAAEHGIVVVPLEVRLGSLTFRDGVDIGTAELYRLAAERRLAPATSQPPAGAFVQAYRSLLERCSSIISIHLASTFSGTCQAAQAARLSLPEADITVVDSGSLSLGAGLQVLRAARAARAGFGKEAVLHLLNELHEKAEVYAALSTLEYLKSGGRIGTVAMLLGSLLNIKPVIGVRRGQAVTLDKTRRFEQAVERLMARLRALGGWNGMLLGVVHTAMADEAEAMRRRMQSIFTGIGEIVVREAGPVLGSHVGPGALAVAVVPGS